MDRREYDINIMVNKVNIQKLIVSAHYEENHPDITDEVIIELVRQLDGEEYTPDDIKPSGFEYFVNDGLQLKGKTYRLIWLLKHDELFIGVVNCYRRD